ncbi:2-hydroxyacyl-CoA dehydratase family protein [[Eubacterium] cellulosolvens]
MTEQSISKIYTKGKLENFNKIWKLFIESSDRIKSSKKKVIAKWKLIPPEIIYALETVPYDLLLHEGSTRNVKRNKETHRYAIEAGLSADFCPLNLSATNKMLSEKKMPSAMSFLGTSGVCDASLKSLEIISEKTRKPLHAIEIPTYNIQSQKNAILFLEEELRHLFEVFSESKEYDYFEESILFEVKIGNRIRKIIQEITYLLSHKHPPISALEYFIMHAATGDYLQNPNQLLEILTEIKDEVQERIKDKHIINTNINNESRVYYIGEVPQNLRFWNLIEECGGVLVGCDTYLPLFYETIPETNSILKDLSKWIWENPYNMPIQNRAESLSNYIKRQNPDCVMIGNSAGCRKLASSERTIKEIIKEKLRIPVTSVEFSSSNDDISLLEPHIKAFIEISK